MRIAGILLVALCCLAGCGENTNKLSETDKEALTVKTPDVTAEQSRERLQNSNISPEAKKVLGGGIK